MDEANGLFHENDWELIGKSAKIIHHGSVP